MRLVLALVIAASLAAACGNADPSVRPTQVVSAGASLTPQPSAAAPIIVPIADVGDAYVATLPVVDGVLTGTVLIEAVSADGIRRPVAALPVGTYGLPAGSLIIDSEPILISPTGGVAILVEGSFDAPGEDPVARRLIVDVRTPGAVPLLGPGGPAAWGPDGRLAILELLQVTVVEPATGRSTVIPGLDQVEPSVHWAADGSGLLATRTDPATESSTAGVLTLDGRFVAGALPSWSATGRDRPFGADGTVVFDAASDGPTGSDQSIVEQGEAPDALVTWLVSRQPGPDPRIVDHAWDAAGVGQWVTLATDDAIELVHLGPPTGSTPAAPTKRATLPLGDAASIVGVAPDDSAVILEMAGVGDGLSLFRVDTRTGVAVRLDRPGGISSFAGWAARP